MKDGNDHELATDVGNESTGGNLLLLLFVYCWVFLFQLLNYCLLIVLIIGSQDDDTGEQVQEQKIVMNSDGKVNFFSWALF